MSTFFKRLAVFSIFIVLLSSGCISRKVVVPADQRLLPAQSRTRTDLLAELQVQSGVLATLSAKVTLDATGGSLKSGVMEDYRQSTGFILIDRPNHIRLNVQALALTIFQMVSDGKEYRASIPLRNLFLIADANAPATSTNPLGNLRPRHMLEALFVDIRPFLDSPKFQSLLEETTIDRTSYYVLSFVDVSTGQARLVEKLWIDRTNLQVARKQIFVEDGKLESEVAFSDYERVGQLMFPMVVFMQRPLEDYSLKITFQRGTSLKLNEKLPAEAFLLERPPGYQLVENPGRNPIISKQED